MKLSQSSLALLEDTLKKAIGKYTCGCEQTIVTDIHLQLNQNSANCLSLMMKMKSLPILPLKNG